MTARDYKVGRGKPPKHTQFKKGQSGNPKGRPRKPKSEPKPPRFYQLPSESYLEEEAYRELLLRENGKELTLPATQAVLRALAAGGIQGKRLHARDFIRLVREAEKENFELRVQRYIRLKEFKRDEERVLADCKRRNIDPPEILPHPEDIVLKPATMDAWIHGPETVDDVAFYEHSMRLRDFCVLVASISRQEKPRSRDKSDAPRNDSTLALGMFLDQLLPRRFRWSEVELMMLMTECSGLSKPERERRIIREDAHLKATWPANRDLTPEIEKEVRRLTNGLFLEKKTDRQNAD